MKKTRLFSRIAAMALVAIMACCMFASAYEGYRQSLYGDNGRYTAYSGLYVNGTRANGVTYLHTDDFRKVGSGVLQAKATLVYADDGAVFYESPIAKNSANTSETMAQTQYRSALKTACSIGWAAIEGNGIFIRLPTCYEGDNYTRSAGNESQLAALAEKTLTEDNTYPVNAAGETYGSILLADMVGEEPDLIYAVNQDDVYGYIRLEDITNANPVFARTATPAYALYDVNGNVIGSFGIGEV
nr:hypothetical protein [uncultured Oscillibacter sp.]